MSWETRGNNRYYYRRRKVRGRVVAEYIGAGALADAVAGLDEQQRRERQRAAAELRAIIEGDNRTVAALAEIDELVRTATTAVLIANGYHTHRRQWRKMSRIDAPGWDKGVVSLADADGRPSG